MTPSNSVKPRILIVDDEHANIEVLIEALPGFALSFATDGARALELAIKHPFDLILLDVVMPGMSGLEVLRWLKSEPRTEHVPVIFVTSMSEFADEERGLEMGAVDYIAKPIRPALVRACVRTHIELKHQRDLLKECLPIDELTGIANRRRFDQELARAWGRAARRDTPLILMLVEIDHFDRYVEHFEQSPGDECLIRVAKALHTAICRGDDLAARYSDRQFALLIDGDNGAAQVRRVLEVVSALEIPHPRSDCSVFVSLSIGAIMVRPVARQRTVGNTANAEPAPAAVNAINSADAAMAMAASLLQAAQDGGRYRGEFLDAADGSRTTILPKDPQVTAETEG